jgi:hypothetical protein
MFILFFSKKQIPIIRKTATQYNLLTTNCYSCGSTVHEWLPFSFLHRKERHTYYALKLASDLSDFLEIKKTIFYCKETDCDHKEKRVYLKISNYNDFFKPIEDNLNSSLYCYTGKVAMTSGPFVGKIKDDCDFNLDAVFMHWALSGQIYFSKKMVNRIKEAELTGFLFNDPFCLY